MSLDSGISGDEYVHHKHAEYVSKYFQGEKENNKALEDNKTLLHFYGQSCDFIAYVLSTLLNIEDYYKFRHFFISLYGWLLMLITGLLVTKLSSWRGGIITLILIFLSPKVLGHSFNNPMDIPFAMAFIFAIYYMLKYSLSFPKISIASSIGISIGIGIALSIRVGGLLLFAYLAFMLGINYMFKIRIKDWFKKPSLLLLSKLLLVVLLISVFSYIIGILFWPYALENPFTGVLNALKSMTNIPVGLKQLFKGEYILSFDLPWYYSIKYILMTTPIVIFVGLAIFIGSIPFRKEPRNNYLFYSFLAFAFVFPITYTIYKNSNLYGGWRHLLFAYAPIVVLSGAGFNFLLSKKNKYIKYGTLALLGVLLVHPIKHVIKNHPYQYVYYNEIAGGVKGAYGNYELDYYYHSLKKGAEWLIENELNGDSVTVATNHGRIASYAFRNNPNVKVEYSRYYEKSKENWDYAVFVNTHIHPHQLKNNFFPPAGTIHTEDVDGMPICAVIKRVSNEDNLGFEALKKRKLNEAEKHFNNYLELNPHSEEVLGYKAQSYLMRRNYKRALELADSSLAFHPSYFASLFWKASALNGLKKYKDALAVTNKLIGQKKDHGESYYNAGYALHHLGRPNEALRELQKAMNFKKNYYDAYMLMGEIFLNYKKYKDALDISYKKVLEFRENDIKTKAKIARCYYHLKDQKNFQDMMAELQKRGSNHFEVIKLQARIHIDNNKLPEARSLIMRMRNVNTSSKLDVIRAKYSIKANDLAGAKKFLANAIELDPQNNEAKELQKELQPKTKAQQTKTKEKPKQQQSIMFQKKQKKNTNILNQRK